MSAILADIAWCIMIVAGAASVPAVIHECIEGTKIERELRRLVRRE